MALTDIALKALKAKERPYTMAPGGHPNSFTWSAQEEQAVGVVKFEWLAALHSGCMCRGTAAHHGCTQSGFLSPLCTRGTGSLTECPQLGLTFNPSVRFLQALLQNG